jgi:AhpD family alkylhydroperoxidase
MFESERIDLAAAAPESYPALLRLDRTVRESKLDPALNELVKVRASQVNQCAFCIDMHTKDARTAGETEQRLYALSAWREAPFFTERERAALALTEAMTTLPQTNVPDAVYEEAARCFDAEELGALIFAIVVINAWNRIGVTTRMVAGIYEP